ncbi:MAG: Gfo/Idh/MocA family oxidoreductase [Armatimonadota bacterium]
MEPVGVGIIGARTGGNQAPGFINDPRISHVVMCDIDEDRLAERAEQLDLDETTTDWTTLLDRRDIGIISVAAPDHLHRDMSIAAMEAGKHVLCEKPMAMNLQEAREMIEAVEATGKKLMVNNILRFFERFKYVKRIVDEGQLGEIYAAEGDYLHDTLKLIREGWRGPHRHSVTTGGGVHLLDLLRWIVGEIEEVFCYSTYGVLTKDEARSPDCMVSVLRFENGAVGKSMTNMAAQRPPLHNFILYGTEGVFVNGKPHGMIYRGHDDEGEKVTATYGAVSEEGGTKHVAVAHLLDAIENDTEPLVSVYEGARTLAVCDAIFESSRTGAAVPVEPL